MPRVAWWFRHASTMAVVTGILLLILSGYLLPTVIYGASVFMPPARVLLLCITACNKLMQRFLGVLASIADCVAGCVPAVCLTVYGDQAWIEHRGAHSDSCSGRVIGVEDVPVDKVLARDRSITTSRIRAMRF